MNKSLNLNGKLKLNILFFKQLPYKGMSPDYFSFPKNKKGYQLLIYLLCTLCQMNEI